MEEDMDETQQFSLPTQSLEINRISSTGNMHELPVDHCIQTKAKGFSLDIQKMRDINLISSNCQLPSLKDIAQQQLGISMDLKHIGSGYKRTSPGKIRIQRENRRKRSRAFLQCHVAGYQTDFKRLHTAISSGSASEVSDLLEYGADPNSADEKKRSALHKAVARGDIQIVRLLLLHGADVNQRDVIGNIPLHLGVITNRVEIVTMLLEAGTDLGLLDGSGHTPLHLARSRLRSLLLRAEPHSVAHLRAEALQVLNMVYEFKRRKGDDISDLSTFKDQLSSSAHSMAAEGSAEELSSVTSLLNDFSGLCLQKD